MNINYHTNHKRSLFSPSVYGPPSHPQYNTTARKIQTTETQRQRLRFIYKDICRLFVDYCTSNTKRHICSTHTHTVWLMGVHIVAALKCRAPDLVLSIAALCTSHSLWSTFSHSLLHKQTAAMATLSKTNLCVDAKLISMMKVNSSCWTFHIFSLELPGCVCAEWAL